MYTSVRSVFNERVCDWYYLWSQLEQFPQLTEDGIDMFLQVVTLVLTGCSLDYAIFTSLISAASPSRVFY